MAGTLNLMPLTGSGGAFRPPIRASIRAFTATALAVDSRRPASLYEVLRIKQNASAVEIKSAYRNLAKVYHPDSAVRRSESDERDFNFIEIHDAYETLSDPSARAVYDLSLVAARGGIGSFSSLVAPSGSSGFYQTRKWETDQCW
ncbi:Chaperone protein dnaJ 11 [Spatholobus suberectus]|nr:Chaperone protein dnaJ 11 [Spatholobus suberectus]